MIDPKELRIGNLINGHHGQFAIGSIEKDNDYGFRLHHKENPRRFDNIGYCEPIPLTEEWLLKLGFEPCAWEHQTGNPVEFYFGIENTMSILIRDDDHTEITVGDYVEIPFIRPDLKYVHQIQNLCFAVTGEELTIIE